MKKRFVYFVSLLIIVALLLSACGQAAEPTEPMETESPIGTVEGTPPVGPEDTPGPGVPGTGDEQMGGSVTVMGVWGGAELENFLAMVQPFEDRTGVQVQFEGTRDITAVLATRIQGGNPPDVAGLPNPGTMQQYVAQGALIPLDDVLDMERVRQEYPEGFLNLSTVNDQIQGIFIKASVKSFIWYRPDVFQERGYQVPQTWEELKGLEQQIIDDGATPWCIGVESGAASGWPATDWIEDIILRTAGPGVYDQWWQHQIPWTDDAVRNAWETWGEIIHDPNRVYGGTQSILSTNFGQSPFPMFDEEPGCLLHRQASFITTFITEQFPEVQLGEDLDFFVFPPINAEHGNPLLVAGDLFGMFNDTPQARALMEYLTTAEAQAIWAERGGFIAPNQAVDPMVYPDQITQQIAQLYVEAESVRFDASDMVPQAVQDAFVQGTLQYIQNPDALQSVLENIESTAQGAYNNQ